MQKLELQKVGKLPLTSDYVFKRVFSYNGNESVLKDFLEAILNISIKKIEVKNPEIIKTSKDAYVDMGYEKEEEIASKYVETHYIEIPKFKKKNPGTKEKIDQWMWLLTGEEDKIKMAEKENDEVKKANDILNRISLNPKEREQYGSMLQAKFNYETGLRNSYEAGKEEGEKVRTRKRGKNPDKKKAKKFGREEGKKIR